MSVLYLLTAPPPPVEGTDAVFNEVEELKTARGGEVFNLYPLSTPAIRVPRFTYGLHAIPALRRAEARHRINHIYYPVLHWFPVLGLLRKPTVYTVTATLDPQKPPRHLARLGALARIVVSNQRDAETLEAWGLHNGELIPPAVETTTIERRPLPITRELTIMMASAPWHRQHFDGKGVDVLLEATAALPDLKLILLWRGLLADELAARIARLQIADRVEVVNEKVDVSAYLQCAHAAVLLAKHGHIIKAYPHSLVEAIAAGRPVLISDKIPMADFVRQHGCGLVVEPSKNALIDALDVLRRDYDKLAARASNVPRDTFSTLRLIDRHRQLYDRILRDRR